MKQADYIKQIAKFALANDNARLRDLLYQYVEYSHQNNSVFAKDNEATLSHVAFIEAVQDATNTFFSGEQIESPDIRVSHVIKGRIPEAIHKPANQLLESDPRTRKAHRYSCSNN